MNPDSPPTRHIRLTSHPNEGEGIPPIHWGAPDPQVRGPLGGLFLVNVVLMGAASAAGFFPIAWEAHLGGFIGGGVAYALLQPRPPEDAT